MAAWAWSGETSWNKRRLVRCATTKAIECTPLGSLQPLTLLGYYVNGQCSSMTKSQWSTLSCPGHSSQHDSPISPRLWWRWITHSTHYRHSKTLPNDRRTNVCLGLLWQILVRASMIANHKTHHRLHPQSVIRMLNSTIHGPMNGPRRSLSDWINIFQDPQTKHFYTRSLVTVLRLESRL